MNERQIVLDTETTGLEHRQGHRIIEIGCVELSNRKLTGNNYHQYLNPEREIDQGAMEVHGITNEFLNDKPLFADISQEFLNYIEGAELIIHNAAFDIGFMDAEFQRVDQSIPQVSEICGVHDTLLQARKMFPGQRNDLDSLCKRYDINNSHRELHGALLDAEILADVYLFLTGGQTALSLDAALNSDNESSLNANAIDLSTLSLPIVKASDEESENHVEWLSRLDEKVDGQCVWSRLNEKEMS
jgi:DNA polymerase-3 subunit epsilon